MRRAATGLGDVAPAMDSVVVADEGDRGPWRRVLLIAGVISAAVVSLVALAGRVLDGPDAQDTTPLGAVDVGFLQDMIDHHEQAVAMAETYLARRPDGPGLGFANEVLFIQRGQIAAMEAWLEEEGHARGSTDRLTMGWMGMPTPLADMPGMQSDAAMAALAAATGTEADRLFFTMMRDHHQGGLHMADFAALGADAPRIRTFAEGTARAQRIEAAEYSQALRRLGLAQP